MNHNIKKVISLLEEIIKEKQVTKEQVPTVEFCISVIENNFHEATDIPVIDPKDPRHFECWD